MQETPIQESEESGSRRRRKARIQCRHDHHRYGSAQPVGGGITRRVCDACGSVSIDLTELEDDRHPALFMERMGVLDLTR